MILQYGCFKIGGGEGTPCSIVSNGADYILKFIINSPGVL